MIEIIFGDHMPPRTSRGEYLGKGFGFEIQEDVSIDELPGYMKGEFGKIGARYAISGLATRMFILGEAEEAGKLVRSGCRSGVKISNEMMKMFNYAHELGTIMEENLKEFNIGNHEKIEIAQLVIERSFFGTLASVVEKGIPISAVRKDREKLDYSFRVGGKIRRILNKDGNFSWSY